METQSDFGVSLIILSRIDRFSLGPIEEGSKRGVTVLEGQGF